MTLALIFTLGVSVKQWQEQGILHREKQLYEAFLKKKICDRVYWFTYGKDDRSYQYLIDPNIKIIPLPALCNSSFGKLLYSLVLPFLHVSQFRQAEVIKSNQMKGSWAVWFAARIHHRKFILRAGYPWSILVRQKYGRLYGMISEAIEGFMMRHADGVVVTSKEEQQRIITRYRISDLKVVVIPNYVDTDLFKPAERRPENTRLVFVGRIHRDKNLENLIRALEGTRLGLDIYGEGPLKEHLQELSRVNRVDVRFKGVVANDTLPEILRQYNYFILPSVYEGMPKALLEAMACGLVVMATNAGGVREIIQDGFNGILFPTGSVEHIRKTIQCLGMDANVECRMKENARQMIEQSFSLSGVADKEAKAINESIAKPPRDSIV